MARHQLTGRAWPGPSAPADWYAGPGLPGQPDTAGQVLRWWTGPGKGWGYDVAAKDARPDPPPLDRRHLPGDAPTDPIRPSRSNPPRTWGRASRTPSGVRLPTERTFPIRTRILRALAVVGLLAGLGVVGGVSTANAYFIDAKQTVADTPTPTATPTVTPTASSTTSAPQARGYCIKVGTGDFKNLWLDPVTGKCPVYSPKDAYWGPVPLGGAAAQGPAGPQGPKGDKGDPGDSIAKVVPKVVTLTASSPATQTVVLTGLPARGPGEVELPVDNSGSAPAGTTVTVTPLPVPAGSTERSFTVTAAGFSGSQTFALSIKVLAVSA